MAAHTPGPWRIEFDDCGQIDPRCQGGWEVDGPSRNPHGYSVEADARLIAAAPTMYQELELAADTFRDLSNVLRVTGKDILSAAADVAERHIREHLDAIAKAEGQ